MQADFFQADLYPDTIEAVPALTADEFFAGKTAPPKIRSLDPAAAGGAALAAAPVKAFVPAAAAAAPAEEKRDPLKNPQSEKEYMDAFHSLRKENEDLKKSLAGCETKMRSLEIQLQGSQAR